jgi:hypothetical protein
VSLPPVRAAGQPPRPARPRLSRLRAVPLLARPIAATMPWATLIVGCLVGTAFLALLAHVSGPSRPLDLGTVRLASLPAIAALGFVLRAPFRPLTQATPVPAWVASAGQILLAAPVLAVTCWVQLLIQAHTIPPHVLGRPQAVHPLIAQLTAWCAVTLAAAACVDRSRYADLGGAVAAPVSLTAIAIAWYLPATGKFLAGPVATAHSETIGWYAIAAAAAVLAGAAMRDHWHRCPRGLRNAWRRRPAIGTRPI